MEAWRFRGSVNRTGLDASLAAVSVRRRRCCHRRRREQHRSRHLHLCRRTAGSTRIGSVLCFIDAFGLDWVRLISVIIQCVILSRVELVISYDF